MNRILDDDDLNRFARRIAISAREHLEAHDKLWVYLPSFQDVVMQEALLILKTVVLHERQMASNAKGDQ